MLLLFLFLATNDDAVFFGFDGQGGRSYGYGGGGLTDGATGPLDLMELMDGNVKKKY